MRYARGSPATALALLTLCFRSAELEDGFENDSNAALSTLYGGAPGAKRIGEKARAVLVFPNIVKPRFIFGRHYGEGVLLADGKRIAHYKSVSATHRLPAGSQSLGYALFFLNDKALQCLDKRDGWEIGVGASMTIVDKHIAKSLSSMALRDDVYAFIFGREGLMSGLGIQGSKITKMP
jgi:lipid-binding SYLF domain-containing protein